MQRFKTIGALSPRQNAGKKIAKKAAKTLAKKVARTVLPSSAAL
jgi:hypothetical protein